MKRYTAEQFIATATLDDGIHWIEVDGEDVEVTIPTGEPCRTYGVRGSARGSITVTGDGPGHAYRIGTGPGNARRTGDGHGNAVRSGTGGGDVIRDGDAYRDGVGAGQDFRIDDNREDIP